MQFNNTTDKNGIIQECERYCNMSATFISGNPTLLGDFTNYANRTLSRLWFYIFQSTGSWEYDDKNYTDLPQATTDLVSGQAKYQLPSTALTVKRLEMKDAGGEWIRIYPLIREEIKVAIDEYRVADGLPTAYRLLGDILELFPAPSYNSTGGLKLYFDRGSSSFASTDTTKSPGFISEFHYLVPVGASLEWRKTKTPNDPALVTLQNDWVTGVKELETYFNKRFPAKKKVIRRRYTSYK